jgi:hypothetical protein
MTDVSPTKASGRELGGALPRRAESGAAMTLEVVTRRLSVLRARRRRVGWFDYSPWSWDMRTTVARALRIVDRLAGICRPLECVHSGKPLRWNAYHD